MIILGSGTTRTAGGGEGSDPYWANVVMLLLGEGTNNSTTITDSSTTPHTLTAQFGAKISTTQSKFSTSSIFIPGTGSGGVSFPDHADWDFGTGDFTFETFMYRTTSANTVLLQIGNPVTNGNGIFFRVNTNALAIKRANGFLTSDTTTINLNEWHHVAWSRASNVMYFGFNGTILSSAALTHSFTPTGDCMIGYDSVNVDSYLTGYLAPFRITKGVGRYTGSYTVPDAPFPTA